MVIEIEKPSSFNEILTLPLYESYILLLVQAKDPANEISDEDLRKVRFGYDIEFDIYFFFSDSYVLKPKQEKAMIQGQTIELADFWTEIEKRQTTIKKLLLGCIDDDPFSP